MTATPPAPESAAESSEAPWEPDLDADREEDTP